MASGPLPSDSGGEIYMDTTGTLFIFVASSSTAPAKLRKVTTIAV